MLVLSPELANASEKLIALMMKGATTIHLAFTRCLRSAKATWWVFDGGRPVPPASKPETPRLCAPRSKV